MSSEWNEVQLGDVSQIRRGSSPRPIINFMSKDGMPWVKIADATESNSRFITRTKEFIKEEGVPRSVIVKDGDLILSNSGTAGLPKFMKITACIHDGWQVFKELNGVDKKFLYYTLINIRSSLLHNAYDSTMKNLTLDMVREAKINLPPITIQKKIAHILSTLDDKIELNRKMNETLEEMAQALFKSWFVNFDPVHAKAGCKTADELEAAAKDLGISKEVLDLFPSEFVESEMGMIPKGWEEKKLYDTAKYINGAAFKSKDFSADNVGLPIVKIVELKNGISSKTKYTEFQFQDKYGIKNGDILYSWSGSPETSLDVFKWFGGNGWLNQHIFKLEFKSKEEMHHTYFLLKSMKPLLVETAKQKQTTGLGHITVADMKRIKIAYPENSLLSAFSKIMGPFFDKSSLLLQEIISLEKTRDTLLPKLLSGEVSV
jgi:type I restriction enzyme S subunit